MTPVGEELLPRESTNLVMLDKILTLCMLGNIFTLLSSADFFQNQLFRKILSGYHQRIKQFGYRLGQRLVGPYLDPNWLPYLSADDPSGQRIVVSGLYKDSHVRQDINSFVCWVIFLHFCRLLIFFKINFLVFLILSRIPSEYQTVWIHDWARHYVRPNLDPNWLQRLSADDHSRRRIVAPGLYKDSHVRQDINSLHMHDG